MEQLFRKTILRSCASVAIFITLTSGAIASPPQPSFDCSKAKSPAELLICADRELAELDTSLNDAFQKQRRGLLEDAKQQQLAEQRQWLHGLNAACRLPNKGPLEEGANSGAIACLTQKYRERVVALTNPVVRGQKQTDTGMGTWPTDSGDPRFTLARIQSDLERVAAGKSRWSLPVGQKADALERIVDAYAAFVKGDTKGMDAALSEIWKTHTERRPKPQPEESSSIDETFFENRAEYFKAINSASTAPLALQRLIAGLRAVDSLLFLEAAHDMRSADLESRTIPTWIGYSRNPLNDTWLRLPCRTVVGRVEGFSQAASDLGEVAGPLLSCPSLEGDFAKLETKVMQPGVFSPHPIDVPLIAPKKEPPPPADKREKAIAEMAEHPDVAGGVLEAASHKDSVGKLDYALFIHAFRPATKKNKENINRLLAPLILEAAQDQGKTGENADDVAAYDGTDESLVPILRQLSVQHVANTMSAFYAIPCAVLFARPSLIEVVESYYGSNMDNFLPRSGCAWGRGQVRGFPDEKVSQFVRRSTEADGHFIDNFQGTMVFGFVAEQQATLQRLEIDPRGFLDKRQPKLDFPYQTWGMTGATARQTSEHIRSLYLEAHKALTAYNVRRGLSQHDAARAAKIGLFRVVFGGDCGGAVPKASIRDMLLRKAPVRAILAQVQSPNEGEAPEVLKCARFAPLEPLVHVAVAHPSALNALLGRGRNVEESNGFRKTPLMVAAQLDQLESAKLLLTRDARINAMTKGELAHDARTPLMYAAANGSLPMIKLLLDAGADPYQADSKGSRSIDYLLGYGPTGANPKLTPSDMAEAARLLF